MHQTPATDMVRFARNWVFICATIGMTLPAKASVSTPGHEPLSFPETLECTVLLEGTPQHLTLFRHSVRGASFEVIVKGASGKERSAAEGPVRTYRGYVSDHPDIQAAALLREDGLHGALYDPDGITWSFSPDGPTRYLAERQESPAASIGCLEGQVPSPPEEPRDPQSDMECGVVRAELALDCSSSCFERKGSSVPEVQAMFEATINELNLIYVRDLRVEYVLGRTVIREDRETDPYLGVDFWDKLDIVRTEWGGNQFGSEHDQAALVDGDGDGSGLAWVGVVCSSSRYSINGFSGALPVVVMRHELGHNWGSNHYEGGSPEGPTIMSGNSIGRFSGPEKDAMMPHRNSRTCLDDIGDYPTPIPPYAHFDDLITSTCTSAELDLLVNDEDANCHGFEIVDWDPTTPLGATLTLVDGRLQYHASPTSGIDSFTYTIRDDDGLTAVGNVRMTVVNDAWTIPSVITSVKYADSEQSGRPATDALDGNPDTFWHTRFTPRSDPLPHEIQIDLAAPWEVSGLHYLPRQDGYPNGHIADFEVYVSSDGIEWGAPVSSGTWALSILEKSTEFPPIRARYVRLRALSEVGGNPWTSAAEVSIVANGLSVDTDALVRGEAADVTVVGGRQGETIYLVAGVRGAGCGPCPPALGGLCLDVLPPGQVVATAETDESGRAHFSEPVPADLVPDEIALQAVAIRGANGKNSVKSAATVVLVQD